ncbi:MAG: hypothetical protein H5T91_10470, partial [Synergistetes bacterium]|nr:hypothetical protein [Synergistota bacterium]
EFEKILKYYIEHGKVPGEVILKFEGVNKEKLETALKRAENNLKSPVPTPTPLPKPVPISGLRPPSLPKPVPTVPTPKPTPKPPIQPLKEEPKVTTTSTSQEKPKTGVLELAKKYWWVLGVLGVGLVFLKR